MTAPSEVQPRPLGASEAAERAGVKTGTWTAYVARGQAPEPDGYVERSPYWWPSTVDEWLAGRPGAGARTDLRG